MQRTTKSDQIDVLDSDLSDVEQPKVRVVELAKELRMHPNDLIQHCKSAGIVVKGSTSGSISWSEREKVLGYLQRLFEKSKTVPFWPKMSTAPFAKPNLQSSQAAAEYIYVLHNDAFPDLKKIGKTIRNPEERAAELSQASGVPHPFRVAFAVAVTDCTEAERRVHVALAAKRANNDREFFRITLDEVAQAIKTHCTGLIIEAITSTGPQP